MPRNRAASPWSHRTRLAAGNGARRELGFLLLLLAGLPSWSSARQLEGLTSGGSPPPAPAREPLAFRGVTVIDVRTGQLWSGQTVVVTGNRIQAVGAAGAVKVPAGARVVDARGKYLLPGFWDMHVHLNDNADVYYPRFIAHGVTGVREMAQRGNYRGQDFRDLQLDVMDGTVVGPRALGPSSDIGHLVHIDKPEDARRLVDSLKAAGDAFVKYYRLPDQSLFFAIMREARRAGLPVVGHRGAPSVQSADSGMRSIEHSDAACGEDPSPGSSITAEPCAEIAKAYNRNGTWVDPTLAVDHHYTHNLVRSQQAVRRLRRAGFTRFLTGSDWIDIGLESFQLGLSLLEEIVFLAGAGLTPLEALQAATLHPAMSFTSTDSLGTVEAGKLADLVLLDANPLADIRHVMRTWAVVANGRYYDRAALESLDPHGNTMKRNRLAAEHYLAAGYRGAAPPQRTVAFRNVTVVDVTDGTLHPAQTVVVAGTRIQAVGPTAQVSVPAGARIVEARGRYLIPGLWDMHAHIGDPEHYRYEAHQDSVARAFYPRFIAHGVTGVREMAQHFRHGADSFPVWQRQVQVGQRVGPRVAGPSTDLTYDGQTDAFRNYGIRLTTPAEAERVMDSLGAAGIAFATLRDPGLAPELYYALARAARRVGVPLVGVVPQGVPNVAAADSGQRSIEHVGSHHECWPGWPAPPDTAAARERCAEVARAYKRDSTWLVPTLSRAEYLDNHAASAAQLVGLLRRAGVTTFLAGSDVSLAAMTTAPAFQPGRSAVEEVVRLAEAGLSPLEALQAATLHPAKFFRATDSLGTVTAGKLADLVLLDGNPLADIRALRKVRAVVADGRYYDRARLAALDRR